MKIVSEAAAGLRRRSARLCSVADLCEVAGVGKSRLHQAFHHVHGVSPGRYIQMYRLMSAHERLLSESPYSKLVKEVALDHGFLSSGQFARAYRSVFGELPRQTLHR